MITKELLKTLVANQNDIINSKERGLKRDRLNEVGDKISLKQILVITGPRRCGKSTLLYQIMDKYYNKDDYFYFSFDDERLSGFNNERFNMLLEVFLENYGKRKVFFFDEVQNVKGWERFISRMYEAGNKFIITGSNANLLSTELSTFLTGRHIDFILLPFSFTEYLKFFNVDFDKKLYSTEKKSEIKKHLNEYIKFGGFPEIIKQKSREFLKALYEDIVYKDVAIRYKIRDIETLKEIAIYLVSNIARPFTYNKLKNSFSLGSTHTAKNYVEYLSNSFLFFIVDMFSYSVKKRIKNPKKSYIADSGIFNELTSKFSEDIGRLYENIFFIELKRRGKEVFYWKDENGNEVDFLIKEKMKIAELIQVCYSIEDTNTKVRETKSLLKAMKEFKLNNGLIITEDYYDEEKVGNKTIKYVPLWRWLLG